MQFLNKVLAIVWKDVLAELRTKEMFSSMLVFALLLIVIFNFSFDLRVEKVAEVAPGVLWVTFAFAGTLELNRALSAEIEEARLDGLLLAPMERSTPISRRFSMITMVSMPTRLKAATRVISVSIRNIRIFSIFM